MRTSPNPPSRARRIALATVLALLVTALFDPKPARAAAKRHCVLEHPLGPVAYEAIPADAGSIVVAARWTATLHCDEPTPLEGTEVDVQLRVDVRLESGGRAQGVTQILIDFTSAGIRVPFAGRVSGSWSTFPWDVRRVALAAHAVAANGAQVRTVDNILIDFTGAGIVVGFTADSIDVTLGQ